MRRTGSTAFSDLLEIDGVQSALGLSYRNSDQLNKIIDEQIPIERPSFSRTEVVVAGEAFDLYKRDILECIRALYGSPEHAQYLCIAPERHYSNANMNCRLYHDIHTGKWWWDTQKAIEGRKPGATIVPVILSSDKTQVTLFRNKAAYPVYLTIGNLPKEIRQKPSQQGQILLGYLPTTKLEHIKNKASCRRITANLFHACMTHLVSPLKNAGKEGVVMQSGDGVKRRCHPILAAYVADYPKQVLVACSYYGDCASCDCPKDELGLFPSCHHRRNFKAAVNAAKLVGTDLWVEKCREENLKPVQHPFWEDLPHANIFRSVTPDVLHQLYQGVMKHLISWLTNICGADKIDARVRRLPLNHGIRHFHKGISKLSRVTGGEHKQICSFLLGLVIDTPSLSIPKCRKVVSATRALLDFLFLACYPVHTDESLTALDAALEAFHENKSIFIDLGIRENFNIPKLHFLIHYSRGIRYFGTTDNYNTETTERLHIDFAKDAYRASNRKDEYAQMTKWLEHPETSHGPRMDFPGAKRTLTDLKCPYQQKMTKNPSVKGVTIIKLEDTSTKGYHAQDFRLSLARFIAQFNDPTLSPREIDEMARFIALPFTSVPIWHQVKMVNPDLHGNTTLDVIKAQPRRMNSRNQVIQVARFDTALIQKAPNNPDKGPLDGMRIGRVRAIFSIPDEKTDRLFPPNVSPPGLLAYVEWFSNFTRVPDTASGLYRVKKQLNSDGTPSAAVVPVSAIKRSIHLFPKWGGPVPANWTCENVLDECTTFYMNPFLDLRTYCNIS
ncbi:hypothetical protein K435DRAFT_822599 [Dendrothele bispora CBS 962.96]|uniref:Uncharacterized protein n=1 Tax=Dendrothele bispora (strain CBS 962.96) TaxID=1314807 RepID=A0A4S8L8G0_DENBC|nr:hypothetical protein K435DRAFT_822599 [Dendrothele bispora CBS 962.96]